MILTWVHAAIEYGSWKTRRRPWWLPIVFLAGLVVAGVLAVHAGTHRRLTESNIQALHECVEHGLMDVSEVNAIFERDMRGELGPDDEWIRHLEPCTPVTQ